MTKLWKGAYVVMDNSSIYKGGDIEKIIEAAAAKLIYHHILLIFRWAKIVGQRLRTYYGLSVLGVILI